VSPLPQRCTLQADEEATLPSSLLPSPWHSPLQLLSPSPLLLPTPLPLPLPSPIAVANAISHCRCGRHQPLPSLSLSRCHQPLPLPLPSPSAIAVSVSTGHCSCHLHRPSPSPSPSAISESCCLGMARIVFKQLKKNAHLILFCSDSGQRTNQSRMTDQASSGDCQHQHWAASSKQRAASGESGWQQGGSRGAAG
jgi:hypothetical protein